MKMKHIHAELMAEYAKDAMETDKPWERWEVLDNSGGWGGIDYNPVWVSSCQYRRKPSGKTVLIDGHEFIVPKSFFPKDGEAYWSVNLLMGFVFSEINSRDEFDRHMKISHNIYKTEEEAEQALKFWQKINEV